MKTSKMRHFLFIALVAGLLSPSAANSEQTLLILEYGVEMNDMEECKVEGERYLKTSIGVRVNGKKPLVSYQCKEVD